MSQIIDKKFTEQDKKDLNEFLDHYGEDIFGHYPANLNFSPQAVPQRPDDTYYQAQGQEPPQVPVKPWYKQAEVIAMLVAILAIWVALAFYPY